jgi:hypothetical protein
MASEIEIIYQLTYKDVFETTSRSESDIKAWIANCNYLLDRPLLASTPNGRKATEFHLRVNNINLLNIALSNDCNRFGQAAFESIVRLNPYNKLPKSSGWSIIKMYYASFFAIHSILRIFGRSCSQFDNEHVKAVFNIALATNQNNGILSIESGFYYSKFDSVNNLFSFSKLKDSHADTWQSFGNLIVDLINDIPSGTTGLSINKGKALDLLIKIKEYLYKSGANKGNWPSEIRNSINYRHSHGVWFPYSGLNFNPELINRNMEWIKDPQSFDGEVNKNEIEVFFNATNCIVSFLYHLVSYGYDKGEKKSIVLRNGLFRLINILTTA